MFGSRHDSFVYCQDWRQTVTSLTLALSVKKSSRGDGVSRRDKAALSDKTGKCVSAQQRGLRRSATERDAVLGQLRHVTVNVKLQRHPKNKKNTAETRHVWTHSYTCVGIMGNSIFICEHVIVCLIGSVIRLKSVGAIYGAKSAFLRFMVNSVTLFLKHSHCYLLMPLLKNAQWRKFHLGK